MTKRQEEILNQIKDRWNQLGEGLILSKKNSLVIHNLVRHGLVKIYPAHRPMKGITQSWEAFPAEVCE